MSERFDAAVIGGGVNGMAAAALLAKQGLRTLLLERSQTLLGADVEPSLHALDPRLVKELKLARRGLKFASRDLTLTALRAGGPGIVIGRDRHAATRSIAVLSPADAAAFALYRRELHALARAMRPTWWDGRPAAETIALLKPGERDRVERLAVTSASAFLATWFESETLRAVLAFPAAACGAAPCEAGSALAMLWSASQEMCGLQDATAIPRGGRRGLLQALSEALQVCGAVVRTGATVSRLVVTERGVSGVELVSGEQIEAPLVLSALPRRRTLGELAPTALIGLGAAQALARPPPGIGAATLLFGLDRAPDFAGAAMATRFVIAERPETYETAHAAARLGQMPSEMALELILPPPGSLAEPRAGRLLLAVRAWPVAAASDLEALASKVVALIERHAPGFAGSVASRDVLLPEGTADFSLPRLLSGAAERSLTSIPGLLLCGVDAEPVDAISGRAARHAVRLALALHRKRGGR